jgi:hypothetical protein
MVKTKSIQMTAKAALCLALLEGKVLNVKNVFNTIGLTNASREIRRMVEIPFSVEVSRTPRTGKNRYGVVIIWTDYYLRKSKHNGPGIARMVHYCQVHIGTITQCKTDKELKQYTQTRLFLDTL